MGSIESGKPGCVMCYCWVQTSHLAELCCIRREILNGILVLKDGLILPFSFQIAVTGSLFRINLGMRGLVAGGIIGALLG